MPDLINFRTCYASELINRSIINGSIIICSDTGEIYHDNLDGERIKVAEQIVYLNTETERTSLLTPRSTLYTLSKSQILFIDMKMENGYHYPITIVLRIFISII